MPALGHRGGDVAGRIVLVHRRPVGRSQEEVRPVLHDPRVGLLAGGEGVDPLLGGAAR